MVDHRTASRERSDTDAPLAELEPPAPADVPSTGDDTPAASLWGYVWRVSGWRQAAACAVALGVAALSLAPVEIQRRAVNLLSEPPQDAVATFGVLAIAYAAVIVAHAAVKFGLRMFQSWIAESTVRYTRRHLLDVRGRCAGDAQRSRAGRDVSVVVGEVEKLGGFVGETISQAFVNAFLLIGAVAYMLAVDPQIAMVALALLGPQIVLSPLAQRWLDRLLNHQIGLVRELSDRVSEPVGDPSCTPSEAFRGRGGPLSRLYRNRLRFTAVKTALKTMLNLLTALAPLSVLVFGGFLVLEGEAELGTVVAFMAALERVADPLRDLLSFYRLASQADVQHRNIADYLRDLLSAKPQTP